MYRNLPSFFRILKREIVHEPISQVIRNSPTASITDLRPPSEARERATMATPIVLTITTLVWRRKGEIRQIFRKSICSFCYILDLILHGISYQEWLLLGRHDAYPQLPRWPQHPCICAQTTVLQPIRLHLWLRLRFHLYSRLCPFFCQLIANFSELIPLVS